MLENSVIVLRKTELKGILKYIKMKYGKNFLSTLKIQSYSFFYGKKEIKRK